MSQLAEGEVTITELLGSWNEGDPKAADLLMERIYPVLRRLAAKQLSSERDGISLQVTDLVHEAYLRLAAQRQPFQGRDHFYAISARLMRRILVDHARSRTRKKRGGGWIRSPLSEVTLAGPEPHPDLLALDRALNRLATIDDSASQLIELRYFAGLTIDESANVLNMGRTKTVKTWHWARAWLKGEIGSSAHGA